ncbi:hypothetical protein PSN45_004255 [Yamadazyma tenuis]|uniref:uncharacterized protein n=1 Tax=Candida tenuis TaxID=2315449 RepID=UPI00279B65A7|nr:hypothetical protein PSN45_004255 [Yamadazyma tenuis]
MQVMSSDDPLNTPIKKIKSLSIHSPDIKQIMVDKGYSNSISDKVLSEMNLRLDSIASLPSSPVRDDSAPISAPFDFNAVHNNHFNQMESIMSHYSIKRNPSELALHKKKRRTLTGIEESPVLASVPNAANRASPTRISPSKKSFNLNGMLSRKISVPKSRTPSPAKEFKRPVSFQRIAEVPSLQKNGSIPSLAPTLHKKKETIDSYT